MPRILTVANLKGGTGKTTTALNLAAILASELNVLLVDACARGSASWWAQRGSMPFDWTAETDPQLLRQLPAASGYDLAAIDTAAAHPDRTWQAAVAVADWLILPAPPTPMALAALIETASSARALTAAPQRGLLLMANARYPSEAREAQQSLQAVGIPTFERWVRAYKVHQRCPLEGIPITAAAGKHARAAAADYRRIAVELLQGLSP